MTQAMPSLRAADPRIVAFIIQPSMQTAVTLIAAYCKQRCYCHVVGHRPYSFFLSAREVCTCTYRYRVSTDLTEQISRRFPGYSRRDF